MGQTKEVTIAVRLNAADKAKIEKYANDNDLSMSQVIRKAIKEYLESLEKENN